MANNTQESNFEITSKRCKGFPSETQVKRGVRVVHGDKEFFEKLGVAEACATHSISASSSHTPLLKSAARFRSFL
jgi:hypothetical protein